MVASQIDVIFDICVFKVCPGISVNFFVLSNALRFEELLPSVVVRILRVGVAAAGNRAGWHNDGALLSTRLIGHVPDGIRLAWALVNLSESEY